MPPLPHVVWWIGYAVGPIAAPFAVLGLLERRWPAGPLKTAAGWRLNIGILLLYASVPAALGAAMLALSTALRRVSGGGLVDLGFADRHGVVWAALACLVFLLAWDFFYYWWHRAQHRFAPLWAIHRLHHSDDSLGVSTAQRVHWLEEIGRMPAILVPMALVFDLPPHTGAVAVALTVWGMVIHANLRVGLGRASALIAGPQLHRIHHSIEQRHHNRNFAAFFPVYDVLFGTYWHPARGEYPATGLAGEREVRSLWHAAILPFMPASAELEPLRPSPSARAAR